MSDVIVLLKESHVDPAAWGLAWARVLPTLLIVPAFGLRAFPLAARVVAAAALALAIMPAIRPAASSAHWVARIVAEVGQGLPVALTSAVALWAATMAGGAVDDLRDAGARLRVDGLESGSTPMGVLLSLLTAIGFLQTGGASRVAAALTRPSTGLVDPLSRAVADLASGIQIALAVAAPLLVVAIVVDVVSALVTRVAVPAPTQPVLAPLRSIAILGVAALALERMTEALVAGAAGAP